MTEFSTLALIDPLQRGLKEVSYAEMTPVQASSLPAILAGRDVVAQARTGSGKTAAFALGLLAALDATSVQAAGLGIVPNARIGRPGQPRDSPTRKVHSQHKSADPVRRGAAATAPRLAAHEPHIVVGTPGRILELIQKEALPLKAIGAGA